MMEMEKEMTTPVLTLDPFGGQPSGLVEVAEEKTEVQQEPAFDDSMLSEEERRQVDDFASQIDLKNSNLVLQYGAGTQKKMADFSEDVLGNVRTKDLGEVGDALTDVVAELKGFDAEEEKGFLGLFKKSSNKLTAMKARYDKAEVNVNKIVKVLEGHQVQLLKDVALLDKMYQLNLNY